MLDKLKIGLMDVLTILVPGGLLLLLVGDTLINWLNERWSSYTLTDNTWVQLALILGFSYIFGHFIYFAASYLDELVYEKVRRVYWHHHNKLTAYVLMLKNNHTGISERKVLSAWKWACAWLMSKQPEIYASVERHIAESKLFRSLAIVFAVAVVVFIIRDERSGLIWLSFVLMFLSVLRYLSQRQKSLETAYHGVITTFGVVLPKAPDPSLLAQTNKRLLFPFEKLHSSVEKKDEAGDNVVRPDKWLYGFLKFSYTVGLCLVPGFSSLPKSKSNSREITNAHRKDFVLRMNRLRNHTVRSNQKADR
jgi:hypothetical protein